MRIPFYSKYFSSFILCWILCCLSMCPAVYADKGESSNFIVEVSENELSLTDKAKETFLSIQQKPMVMRAHLVKVSLELLNKDTISLNLFNNVHVTAQKTQVIKQSFGTITWVGYVDNEHNAVIITQQGNEVTGSVWLNNIYYSIRPLEDGIHVILEIDQSKFPPDESEGFEEGLLKNKQNFQEILRRKGKENDGDKNHDGTTSRVLIAYTTAAANAVGNTLTMSQDVITDANASYVNSAITPRLQLAYVTTVAYTESGSFQTDLARLVNGNDGFMDQIPGLRDGSGSDFVILIIDSPGTDCGLAQAIYAQENEAFAVVEESCMLGNHSFAHEIGHLQGGRHDPFMDNNTSPFAYGHGFTHADPNPPDSWRTIMAYNNACAAQGVFCTRIQFWSNPNVFFRGDAMGTAQTEDNHRVLNETEYDMADFRVLPSSINYVVYTQTSEDVEAAKSSITINGQGNISSGANVTFEAPTVTLQGNFTSQQGSEFHIHSGYK